ncbi:ribosomal protein S18-alanine N-acetyltransferase [Timonella sp. A28]|uniref:ribosomal protein S18-alanine N-acetyltransferase n=1 Tax=Timonella sp. A28 TaxID=3442640 RepID=UPI003EBC6CA6
MTHPAHARPRIDIRAMRAQDLDRITALELELFGSGAWTYGMLADELGASGRWYIVAEYDPQLAAGDERVVGYAGLWFDGDVAQVMTIGVARDAQHLGIGSQLMNALIERSLWLRAQALLLEVATNNDAALNMYAKYGFEQIAVRKRYYQPENLDAFVMRKQLVGADDVRDEDVSADPIFGMGSPHVGHSVDANSHSGTDPKGQAGAVLLDDDIADVVPHDVASAREAVFISAQDVHTLLRHGPQRNVRVLDVRWQLGRTDGLEQYRAAHIPTAAFADLDTQLAAPPTPQDGRHPLPALADLQAAAQSWGVERHSTVVVYDAVGGMSAARLWWLLKWAGCDNVKILDGGLPAWQSAGYPTRSGVEDYPASAVTLESGHMPTLKADDVLDFMAEGILIDARATERYRGDVEPVDPRAGHIPGAVNVPTAALLDDQQKVLPTHKLIEIFHDCGVISDQFDTEGSDVLPVVEHDVAVYCGSGVTASHEIAVLASLGVDAALYAGSWSQWSNNSSRPVHTGA